MPARYQRTPTPDDGYGTRTPHSYDDKEQAGFLGGTGASASQARRPWISRHKCLTALIGLLVLALIGLGVGLGVGLGTSSSGNGGSSNDRTSASGSSSGSSGSSSSGSKSGSTTSSAASPSITPFSKWNLADPERQMYGASLGNWLLIERWIDEDWLVGLAGQDVYDEWGLVETLGRDAALSALQEHWDSWVTEAELDTMKDYGFNTIRIPVGYWAFIDAVDGEPYLAKSGQTEQLSKVLGWLYDRGMYASIDLHGMPGSQNGDQSSGHNTTGISPKIGWFSDANQQASYETLNATIAFIQNSPYKSIVNSIGIVNEPRPWDSSFSSSQQTANAATLRSFYENSYQICKEAGIPVLFHHGFYSGSGTPANYWRDFTVGKDPNYIGYEDHPYPGWFTANNNSRTYMQDNVCDIVQGGVGYPVPMFITEWSSINGVYDHSWTETYTNMQLAGYAWSGGSVFWNFKTMNSTNPQQSLEGELQVMYSALGMINSGILQKPAAGQDLRTFFGSLTGATTCGDMRTNSFTNPSSSGASYSRRDYEDDNISMRQIEDEKLDALSRRLDSQL